jgi:hypothetical protein
VKTKVKTKGRGRLGAEGDSVLAFDFGVGGYSKWDHGRCRRPKPEAAFPGFPGGAEPAAYGATPGNY